MSKKNYIVDHPRTYLAVDKKLQHVPKGTPLTLTPEQAKGLGKRVVPADQEETVELTQGGGQDPQLTDQQIAQAKAAELQKLKARAAELNIPNAASMNEVQLTAEIKKAEDTIAQANNAVNS